MKLLIVVPDFGMEPTGLAYVSGILKKHGHQVDCVWQRHVPDLEAAIRSGGYRFVMTGGLSVHFRIIKEIVEAAKRARTRVILGGGLITVMPELVGDALGIDYSVLGEGEASVIELLEAVESGKDPVLVPGIAYLKNGKTLLSGERKPIRDLDSLPYPDWSALHLEHHLDIAQPSMGYLHDPFDHPRLYPLIASRSCPYACTFCDHPLGRIYRQRSIDSVMAELRVMVPKYKINIVSIYDELFSVKKPRVLEWCEKFDAFRKEMGWDMAWNAQMRCDQVDEEMMIAMKRSGCHLISYGFESYSKEVLDSMQKKGGPEEIDKAIRLNTKHRISIQGNFIFGDPAETYQTAQETLRYWDKSARGYAGVNLGFIIAAPDSGVYRHCVKTGLIGDKLDFIQNRLYDIMNFSKMSDRQFERLKFDIMVAKARGFSRAVPRRVGDDWLVVDCPHCSETVTYRNFDYKELSFLAPPLARPGKLFFSLNTQCRACRGRFYVMSRLQWLWLKLVFLIARPALYRAFVALRGWARRAIKGQRVDPRLAGMALESPGTTPRPWLKVGSAPKPVPDEMASVR